MIEKETFTIYAYEKNSERTLWNELVGAYRFFNPTTYETYPTYDTKEEATKKLSELHKLFPEAELFVHTNNKKRYCEICGAELVPGENWYTMRKEYICTKCQPRGRDCLPIKNIDYYWGQPDSDYFDWEPPRYIED